MLVLPASASHVVTLHWRLFCPSKESNPCHGLIVQYRKREAAVVHKKTRRTHAGAVYQIKVTSTCSTHFQFPLLRSPPNLPSTLRFPRFLTFVDHHLSLPFAFCTSQIPPSYFFTVLCLDTPVIPWRSSALQHLSSLSHLHTQTYLLNCLIDGSGC